MRIPRIFHFVWLGGNQFPPQFKEYQRTWAKKHPNWVLKVWSEKNLFNLINKNYLSLCNNYSEMSDLIRYECLYRYGGIYLDVDFECFKNIEPLIEDREIFISTEDNYHLCGGIIGSVKNHPLIYRLIKKIPTQLEETKDLTSDKRIGPKFVTENIRKDEITVLPKEYFYPYLPGQNNLKENLSSNKECYAAHHWSASWLKNPIINEDSSSNFGDCCGTCRNSDFAGEGEFTFCKLKNENKYIIHICEKFNKKTKIDF